MNQDPLITDDDSKRFTAPIRKDPRPLYGIFHATFVLSRIARVLLNWHKVAKSPYIDEALQQVLRRYRQGFETILTNASLTPLGKTLLANTREIAEGHD